MSRKLFVRRGQRFGRGVVIDPEAGSSKYGSRLARLRCDYDGNEYEAALKDLMAGRVQSCGCLHKELAGKRLSHWRRSRPLEARAVSSRNGKRVANRPEWLEYLRQRNQTSEARAISSQTGRRLENLKRLERLRGAHRLQERFIDYVRSQENLDRLAMLSRLPEHRAQAASVARQFWSVPRIGEKHESIDAPDPDWCERHDISFYDHTASQQRQKCYLSWDAREEESG